MELLSFWHEKKRVELEGGQDEEENRTSESLSKKIFTGRGGSKRKRKKERGGGLIRNEARGVVGKLPPTSKKTENNTYPQVVSQKKATFDQRAPKRGKQTE